MPYRHSILLDGEARDETTACVAGHDVVHPVQDFSDVLKQNVHKLKIVDNSLLTHILFILFFLGHLEFTNARDVIPGSPFF